MAISFSLGSGGICSLVRVAVTLCCSGVGCWQGMKLQHDATRPRTVRMGYIYRESTWSEGQ